MKKTILAVLMVLVVATPCLAQEIAPDGLFSIEGTVWRAADRDDLDFAFYNGELFVNCMWMEPIEGDCENGELIPLDSVIIETGRIGFSLHVSLLFSTHIFRFEVVDIENNKGSIQLWHVELWPSDPNPFFIFSPGLIDGDMLSGIGVYRHHIYGSRWEDVPPVLLFKIDNNWTPPEKLSNF